MALLRGNSGAARTATRPPWALHESLFVESCDRQGQCIAACPEKIIEKGRGGFPQINFQKGECTFCGECVDRCTSGALSAPAMQAEQPAWQASIRIKENCLAMNRVVCRSCAEQCDQRAIFFSLSIGGIAQPELVTEQCNGCGACVAPCPVAAIELKNLAGNSTGEPMQERVR